MTEQETRSALLKLAGTSEAAIAATRPARARGARGGRTSGLAYWLRRGAEFGAEQLGPAIDLEMAKSADLINALTAFINKKTGKDVKFEDLNGTGTRIFYRDRNRPERDSEGNVLKNAAGGDIYPVEQFDAENESELVARMLNLAKRTSASITLHEATSGALVLVVITLRSCHRILVTDAPAE